MQAKKVLKYLFELTFLDMYKPDNVDIKQSLLLNVLDSQGKNLKNQILLSDGVHKISAKSKKALKKIPAPNSLCVFINCELKEDNNSLILEFEDFETVMPILTPFLDSKDSDYSRFKFLDLGKSVTETEKSTIDRIKSSKIKIDNNGIIDINDIIGSSEDISRYEKSSNKKRTSVSKNGKKKIKYK